CRRWIELWRGLIVRMSYFFFQAEDGIRDYKVTGVQTCALPISEQKMGWDALSLEESAKHRIYPMLWEKVKNGICLLSCMRQGPRSEERRVGKECRSRRARCP